MNRLICLLVLFYCIPGMGDVLFAQTVETKAVAPIAGSAAVGENPVGSEPESSVLIRTGSGELIPLFLGKDVVNELLERAQEQRSTPRFTILQQEISASVNRDEVRLKIELQIRVSVEAEWVILPLSFGDVYVTQFSSTSEDSDGQAILTSGEQNSRRWHLKGKGLHKVSMELVGKTRTVSPGVSQFSLNLPVATASHAEFSFAVPVEIQKLPAGSVDKATRDEQGVRKIEFWGLASGFNISWSEIVARIAQKPVIQVQNRMKLDLTTIPVTLTGTQVLQISGSPISEVHVTFPEGFQLVEADARNSSGISVLNNFESPSMPGPVSAVIRLTSAMEGTLVLSFDLELMNRLFPQDIRVSIPAIQDANQQPGDLDILFPTGLVVQQTELKGAQRIRVTAESDLSVASTAFRMRSPDSQIVLHVEETEAQFAVSPELSLQTDPDNVIMTARYPVSVLKGSLLDLSIVWPGYSTGEWKILQGTLRLFSGKENRPLPLSLKTSETEIDVLEMTFPERQSGEFMVEFRAFASLPKVRSGEIQLLCPEVQSRRATSIVIRTIESDEYSIFPISMGTGERLGTIPSTSPLTVDKNESGLHSESWLHDDPSIPVRLELRDQAPSVVTEITLGMEPRENGIEIRQLIRFEIEHRDMQGLSLLVPNGIQPTVRVAGQTESLRATIESSNWSFRLPEPRRGSLTLEVTYLWTAPMEAAQSIDYVYDLPLVLPQNAKVLSVEVGTSSLSGLKVSADATWSPVYSEKFDLAMETSRPITVVPVKWADRLAVTSSTSPDLIFARTRIIGNQAITSTLAVYDSVPEFVAVETPEDLKVETVLFGTTSLTPGVIDPTMMQAQRISDRKVIRRTISSGKIPGAQSGPFVLEFRVRESMPENPALWLTARFQRAVVVGESAAIPLAWCVGSQDEFQAVSASSAFTSLTQRGATILPGGDTVRTIADRQLKAVLSSYSKDLQAIMLDRTEEWLSQSGRQDVFFGSAESGPLTLYLVPHVTLLLVSAVTCILFFLLMSVFRQITIIVPVLFLSCLGLVLWLLFPERTLMLAPYAGMGIIFGIVSVVLQRLTTDRRVPFVGTPRAREFPTVFGFSGVLSSPHSESAESSAVQVARLPEVSAGSAR